jgi:hypothetical protein
MEQDMDGSHIMNNASIEGPHSMDGTHHGQYNGQLNGMDGTYGWTTHMDNEQHAWMDNNTWNSWNSWLMGDYLAQGSSPIFKTGGDVTDVT